MPIVARSLQVLLRIAQVFVSQSGRQCDGFIVVVDTEAKASMIGSVSSSGPQKRNMRSVNVLQGSAEGGSASTMVFVSGNVYKGQWMGLPRIQQLPDSNFPSTFTLSIF